ncbi:MAG: OPT family oligopeptide transporter [bacterium]|nr:OPT family oligopeptide transporter [bacterium]
MNQRTLSNPGQRAANPPADAKVMPPVSGKTLPVQDDPFLSAPMPRGVDRWAPQITVRAMLTGAVLGSVLAVANVYVGLKAGIVVNVSLIAALLGYGFWAGVRGLSGGRVRPLGILENNINQTAASAGASVASAGLVHAVPAWAILTGQTLTWHHLALWTLSVCLVGITVAIALRRHMVVDSGLPFPIGMASAEMLGEIHRRGREALGRVATMFGFAVLSAGVYLAKANEILRSWIPPFSLKGVSAGSLTFALNPTLLWAGVGGLIGFRACASMMLGSIVALGVIAPTLIANGTITAGEQGIRYSALQGWLMWPGVVLMVVASFTSLALSWRSIAGAVRDVRRRTAGADTTQPGGAVRRWFAAGVLVALALSTVLQVSLFDIMTWAAVLSVLLAFVLAVVAARVAGETGVTPVGSMGKVSQLIFGTCIPANPVPNLMAANVAGGAASQCSDLLADLKCGHLLGASPRLQAVAQVWGVAVGSLVGAAAYLLLIPDPQTQLMTKEWPAAGVAVWKAVAELFAKGPDALPTGAMQAMIWAGAAGLVLAVIEKAGPRGLRPYALSPASFGLAFVIPASYAISFFLGGSAALIVAKIVPQWSKRFLVAACVGIIAGEIFLGMGFILTKTLSGG